MSIFKQNWEHKIVLIASLGVLLLHVMLGSYSRFIADDYCSAYHAIRLGALRAAWFWYLNWTGIYSANFLDAVVTLLGPGFMPFLTGLVLSLWWIALGFVIYASLDGHQDRRFILISASLSAGILFLTLSLTPDIRQSLYWGQGMRSVVPPLIVITIYGALFQIFRSRDHIGVHLAAWLAASGLLTCFAGGFSETYTAFQLSGLAAALIFFRLKREKNQNLYFILSGLVGAGLALAAVVASPGNPNREAFFPPHPDLPLLTSISVQAFGDYLISLWDSPLKGLAIVGAVGLGVLSAFIRPWRQKTWETILVLLIGIGLVFSCFPPSAYGTSQAPPGRTLIIATYALVMTLWYAGYKLGELAVGKEAFQTIVTILILLVFIIAASLAGNGLLQSRPTFAHYAAAWDQFNAQLIADRSAGLGTVTIDTTVLNKNNWSDLNVLGDNPKFWLNQCVSDYYGIQVVSKSPP